MEKSPWLNHHPLPSCSAAQSFLSGFRHQQEFQGNLLWFWITWNFFAIAGGSSDSSLTQLSIHWDRKKGKETAGRNIPTFLLPRCNSIFFLFLLFCAGINSLFLHLHLLPWRGSWTKGSPEILPTQKILWFCDLYWNHQLAQMDREFNFGSGLKTPPYSLSIWNGMKTWGNCWAELQCWVELRFGCFHAF